MPIKSAILSAKLAKGSTTSVVGSTGFTALSITHNDTFYIVLGVIALIVSIFAFLYDHHHTPKINRENGISMFTTLGMYVILGTPALPAAYNFSLPYTSDQIISLFIGVVASWVAVSMIKAIKAKAIKDIKDH